MNQSEIERIKLLANWFDRASTAMLTIGFLAPYAAAIYAPPQQPTPILIYVLGAIFWLSGAYALHWLAGSVLGRLGP
jgi:hypothetical protein